METSEFPGAAGYTRPSPKNKLLQSFDDLGCRQGRDKGTHGGSRYRMPPVWGQVGQWPQHESTVCHPRVRQDCLSKASGRDFPMIIKKIEVDPAGCIWGTADPPKRLLDLVQDRE
jgi:hypothetical protein